MSGAHERRIVALTATPAVAYDWCVSDPPGTFIVLEGGDGAGKTSVQAALGERLRARGCDAVLTREPGGTAFGERVRDVLLGDATVGDPLAELLLFEAARAHLVATVIRPALARGAVVLCDRFASSSIAYQGAGRGLERTIIEQANAIATGGLAPDLTLLLDVPAEAASARRARGGDANHFDAETAAFHDRVRQAFLDLAAESPATWHIVDASQPLDDVVAACWREVAAAVGLDA
jgi:dTMP kinase